MIITPFEWDKFYRLSTNFDTALATASDIVKYQAPRSAMVVIGLQFTRGSRWINTDSHIFTKPDDDELQWMVMGLTSEMKFSEILLFMSYRY